jgi:hypothetical protein
MVDRRGLPEIGNGNRWEVLAVVSLGEDVSRQRPKAQFVVARRNGWRCCR